MQSETFGRRLGELRIKGGLTQQSLAERAGLSVRGISDLERGIRQPRIDTLNRIMHALGIDRSAFHFEPDRIVEIPAALDAFVGREDELESLSTEVRSGRARLLTLAGAPGVGKSRLAQEISTREERGFEHGAAFIRLCVLRNPEDFPAFLAKQLGADSFSTMQDRFRSQRFLLVLDNTEHLPGIVDAIVTLLERAPMVMVISTGRRALCASGERVREIQPLPLPDDDDPDAILAAPSTQLFTTRVRERLALPLSREDAVALARIVRAVDGLPLALELAAMQMSTHSLDEVARHAEDVVAAASGSADRPLHSRSLESSLEWTVRTLSPQCRFFLSQLSVFVGTFTIDAAAYVGSITLDEARRHVATLRETYLLVHTPHSRLIAMLSTVRRYLLAELNRTGNFDTARERHAQWYGMNAVSELSAFDNFPSPVRTLAVHGLENNLQHTKHTAREMLAFAES